MHNSFDIKSVKEGRFAILIFYQTKRNPTVHPLDKPLQVSVHAFGPQRMSSRITTFHDSDYCSSGGGYLNHRGNVIAMHLGAEVSPRHGNLPRGAITFTEIARQVPNGVIAQLANGQMRQDAAYESRHTSLFLAPNGLNVFFDEEGKNPKAMLKKEASKYPHVKMKTDQKGDPSTKFSAMKHIQQHAPALYHQVLNASVNHGGLHRDTREDSIERLVESDHLIPYDVWKNTINPKMSAIFKKQVQLSNPKEKRPGEDGLAAVTILCPQHRGLLTTKSANFRAQLVQQCDLGRIDVALEMILKDYQRVGALPANKIGVAKVLDLYEKSKIISTAEKVILVAKFLT